MKKLLTEISEKAIDYENFNFTPQQIEKKWLGNIPAMQSEIVKAEIRLGVKFPEDYIEFLSITNGFSAPNDIEPSFGKIEEVDLLKNVIDGIFEAYNYLPELESAIIVAGKLEEQYFLLLPPKSENEKWKYWKFANWYPGENPYKNLNYYFEEVLEFIINEHENTNNNS